MKRSQGLPLNTIVLAALAVLVLLLIVGFTTGSLSKLFGGFASGTQGVDIDKARSQCQQYCAELKNLEASGTLTKTYAENSRYATTVFAIDMNKDGKIDANERNIHCWEYPINVPCTVMIEETKNSCVYNGGCDSITDQATCSSTPGCKWNGQSCEYDGSYCDQFKDPNACISEKICRWGGNVYLVCQPQGKQYVCK